MFVFGSNLSSNLFRKIFHVFFECLNVYFFLKTASNFRFPFSLRLLVHQQIKEEISNKNSVLRILKADGGQTESVTISIAKFLKLVYSLLIMSKRKLLSVEKDTEELFNILFSDQNTTAIAAEVDDAEELQFVLQPPLDGQDSDRDDAPSDGEEASANIKDIGRGVLSQRAEVRIVSRSEKKDLNVESITSDEPTTSNKKQRKTQKKTRKWKSKKLESSRVDSLCDDNSEVPAIVKTILDQNLKPVDLFKLCFDDEIMNHICNESGKYAFQKGDSQFTVSVEELYRYFAILLLSGYNKMPF